MRKIIVSAGLVALGATGLQAAYAPGLSSTETSKPWAVSATLRGFYDDNYTTAPKGSELSSLGFEVRPSLGLNLSLGQTYVGLRYIYDLKYYEDRPDHSFDHTHQFDGVLSHTISERYSIDLSDSFVIAQEPELLSPSGGIFVRTEGNNIRNRASVAFNAQLTTVLSLLVGYDNTLIDYEQESDLTSTGPSRSGLLDRMEHLARVNLRWQALPQTVGILGYQFGIVGYTSDESLDFPFDSTGLIPSDIRDSRSHYVYVGADHSFRPDLTASARVGGQFVDYVNDPAGNTSISPYVDASVTYSYMSENFVQLGLRHSRNATDVGSFVTGTTDVTRDQESTSVYAQLNHRITPSLTGNVLAQFQNSTFNGGPDDGDSDSFFLAGLNLTYRFNQFLSAETGYNYDRLSSDVGGRNYVRNRVYVGVTANY